MNMNVAKLIEVEKKYEEEVEERKKVQERLETVCTQLSETEQRAKDMVKELEETRNQLSKLWALNLPFLNFTKFYLSINCFRYCGNI